MYVCMHVHACVYFWRMTLSISKRKRLICCEENTYFLPRCKLDLTEAIHFTEAVASVASYVHVTAALPVNSVNVTTPAKKRRSEN